MRGRGGVCMAGGMHGSGGHAWWGHAWQGAYMAEGVHGMGACMAGGHVWQERWPLQQTVRILLECFLVEFYLNFLFGLIVQMRFALEIKYNKFSLFVV